MTRRLQITELKDFRSVCVRCRTCGVATVFPVTANIKHIIECQGCGTHLEMKCILALVAGLQAAQSGASEKFDLEFDTDPVL